MVLELRSCFQAPEYQSKQMRALLPSSNLTARRRLGREVVAVAMRFKDEKRLTRAIPGERANRTSPSTKQVDLLKLLLETF